MHSPLLQEASQAPTHTWQRHRLMYMHQGLNPKGWGHPTHAAPTRGAQRSANHSQPPPELKSTHPLLQEARQASSHTWVRSWLKYKHQGLNPKGVVTPTRNDDARGAALPLSPTHHQSSNAQPPAAGGQPSTHTHMGEELAQSKPSGTQPQGGGGHPTHAEPTRVTRRSANHPQPPPELKSSAPLLQMAREAPPHTWLRP
jgi:hypothetical protein